MGMRVFISADLEGISGVVDREHTDDAGRGYERARRLMTGEVNAAVEGALAAGAGFVLVNDSHGSMRNILIEELHPDARLITGCFKALSMMEGIDGSIDVALFIGYHARAGTPGVLNHTYFGRVVADLALNGRQVGETGMNAAVAGWYGVPVALVSGDSAVADEARALLPWATAVAVKEPVGRYAASCLTPARARDAIRAGAEAAVRAAREGAVRPFKLDGPATFELTLVNTAMADVAELVPGVERLDPLRIRYRDDDYIRAFKAIRAVIALAGTTL